MPEKEIDGLIRQIEAGFEAAVAREEEEAALDLARSLMQGMTISDSLRRFRCPVVLHPDGFREPVDLIGTDFIVAGKGRTVMPFRALVLVDGHEEEPARSDESLITYLRGWARAGAKVLVTTTAGGTVSGDLAAVALDHLEVRTAAGSALIASDVVSSVRLSLED